MENKIWRRTKPNERPTQPRPMQLTPNDEALVKLVFDYGVLTQRQLERLLKKSKPTVQRELVRLYHHRFLNRLFLPIAYTGSSPALYIIDQRGKRLLQSKGISEFRWLPHPRLSSLFLRHTLAINEFRINLDQACKAAGWTLENWRGENEIKADHERVKASIKSLPVSLPFAPDSYFSVKSPGQRPAHFFLELDRDTMTVKRFARKIAAYVAYYKTKKFERRYGGKGFRLLTVLDTTTKRRIENLVAATETRPQIGHRFWFTCLQDTYGETLTKQVWRVAGKSGEFGLFDGD